MTRRIDPKRFTTDEQRLMVSAINRHGTGGHPAADDDTLDYFEDQYVVACLRRGLPSMSAKGVTICDHIIEKILTP